MATVQDVIKNYIVGEIFCDYPTDLDYVVATFLKLISSLNPTAFA